MTDHSPSHQEAERHAPSFMPRREFYRRLGAFAAVVTLGLTGIYYVGNSLIEKGNDTIESQITDATKDLDEYYSGTQAGFNDAKKRFDEAKERCSVIEEVTPQINAIAEAVGGSPNLNENDALGATTTTTSVVGP